jgi:hypothetical protein
MEEHMLRVFENRVLKSVCGPKTDEVTGEWRLHNDELYDFYSPNVTQEIKSKRMKWAGHEAHMGKRRGACRDLVGRLQGKNHLDDLGVNGIILK